MLVRNGEDDTVFENMLACCREGDLEGLHKLLPAKKLEDDNTDDTFSGFLERAAKVCEGLCEENLIRFGPNKSARGAKREGMFDAGRISGMARGDGVEWSGLGAGALLFVVDCVKEHFPLV